MPEKSARLSAVSLRLAGEVGQRALDHVAASGAAAKAELDQHICAVRAAIAEYPMAGERQAAAISGRAAVDARVGAAGYPGLGDLLSAFARSCPDVPFVGDASSPEETVPLAPLLHYLCGFIEEAVTRDWWPGPDPDAPDWESYRIAAVCQLISLAEAAAELHPDLHPPALAG
jgi:hypothetical protein